MDPPVDAVAVMILPVPNTDLSSVKRARKFLFPAATSAVLPSQSISIPSNW